MPTGARLARTDDVDAIAMITAGVWRERLGPVLAPDEVGLWEGTDFASVWGDSILQPPSPLYRVAVAVDDDDRVCGYAAWGPAADTDSSPGDVEVFAFDVDPQKRRQGHGSRLMSALVDMTTNQGATSLSMWCTLDDEGRRNFLTSSGWAPDSAWREIEISSSTIVREVRLVTGLV